MTKLPTWASFGLKALVSAGLIAFVIYQIDLDDISGALTHFQLLPALGAVVLFALSNLLGAIQWGVLLKGQELEVKWKDVLRLYLVGVFFNNFMVGNLAGDVVRVYDVRRSSGRGPEAFVSTVMDRFLGLFTMMLFAGMGCVAIVIYSEAVRKPILPVATTVALVIVAFGLMGVVLTSRRAGGLVDDLMRRLLPESVRVKIGVVRSALTVYRSKPVLLMRAAALSLIVQFLRILVHYLCGKAMGVEATLIWFVVFIPLVGVVAMLPISIGGLGPRENVAVGLFAAIGVPAGKIVVMELLAHLATLVSSLPGGVAFLLRRSPNRSQCDLEQPSG